MERRQQQARQNRDNRDDDEKFDEREALPRIFFSGHTQEGPIARKIPCLSPKP
jgi:hypothetical protein